MPGDQRLRGGGIALHTPQDFRINMASPLQLERGARQGGVPFLPAFMEAEIGVQEMPAWSQHPRDFRQKPREIRITMRGLHIDDPIKRLRAKRQVSRITLDELQLV